MKITLADNLRKLRRDKDLTQEELGNLLGISYQSVSKWERGEGYPDIIMLPIIANYFGITVDTLIGNDITSRDERIKAYCDEYWFYNQRGEMDSAIKTAESAYRDYPYDWNIIDIYCLSLTRGYSLHPGEKLPELRAVCKMIMDKCPDAKIRMHAVYSMIFAEDDDKVEKWFSEVPGTYDFTEWERREERYFERGQKDKFKKQKEENMLQLFEYFYGKISFGLDTAEEKITAYKNKIAILDVIFGENALCQKHYYGMNYLQLASALFEVGQNDEAYEALEKSVICFEEWYAIPDGIELPYTGIFNVLTLPSLRKSDPQKIISFFTGDRHPEWFESVRSEERFVSLTERVKLLTK